jgi:multiple sugar transport system ATP-binding protein
LHDRMKATTVYVTHDQLEAMQMGDKIVVMNHGVVEQFGKPQDVYDKPATMFVAEFIGSPSMNFLRFHGNVDTGGKAVKLQNQKLVIPQMREPFEGDLAFGVRPEHIRLTDKGNYRGEVKAKEYLGTTQIVTLKTSHGVVKARAASGDVARVGETVGLEFDGKTVTLFDNQTGRALRSELNEGVLAHG